MAYFLTMIYGLGLAAVGFVAILLLVGVFAWLAHKLSPYKHL